MTRYEDSTLEREQLSAFDTMLASKEMRLNESTEARLMDVMYKEREKFPFTGSYLDHRNPDISRFTAENPARFRNEYVQLNEGIAKQAASLLPAEQLEAFRKIPPSSNVPYMNPSIPQRTMNRITLPLLLVAFFAPGTWAVWEHMQRTRLEDRLTELESEATSRAMRLAEHSKPGDGGAILKGKARGQEAAGNDGRLTPVRPRAHRARRTPPGKWRQGLRR